MKTCALGVVLYYLDISCRNTGEVVSSFEPIRSKAIGISNHRIVKIFNIQKIARKIIAVDETKIKIKGRWHVL